MHSTHTWSYAHELYPYLVIWRCIEAFWSWLGLELGLGLGLRLGLGLGLGPLAWRTPHGSFELDKLLYRQLLIVELS